VAFFLVEIVPIGILTETQAGFSQAWPTFFGALAVLLLLSGLDDLIPLVICLWHWLRRRRFPIGETLQEVLREERRIAIFVPCWKEAAVIGNMVRHNIAAIRYRRYDFFLGVYPNDEATTTAAEQLAGTFHNVHVAACPHPGPTSKADCLNWIYHRMLQFELDQGTHFDTIVLHDAEDLIHPDALPVINREREKHTMVQVPVLPLPTPWYEITHGVYCDEFSEFQTIDMPARQASLSFVPSNGVGTGFARDVLDQLADDRQGVVFDPTSLTEDYEIGVYIHLNGAPQLFFPLTQNEDDFVATREYFPYRVKAAIRQRTRWVTGIALQCWERHGWSGSWRTRYWFWRDRKGLIANPISLLTNLLFVGGVVDWFESSLEHRPWAFALHNPAVVRLCWMTLLLQCFRTTVRMACVARVFGPKFALGVPLRSLHGNVLNCCASLGAIARYLRARFQRRPLVWLKTEHAYPTRAALVPAQRELKEVLVAGGLLSENQIEEVLASLPPGFTLEEWLRETGTLTETEVCRALSMQAGVAAANVDARNVRPRIARSLPAHIQERFQIVPFDVKAGKLLVAGSRIPPSPMFEELKSFCSLPVEFQLVTEETYQRLRLLV
jgi:adsorption protein B